MQKQASCFGTDPESGFKKFNLILPPFFIIWLICLLILQFGFNPEIPREAHAIQPNAALHGDGWVCSHAGFGNLIPPMQLAFSPAKSRGTKTDSRPLFGENPGVWSIMWSILWQIPWKAQFGRFFEWTPFIFAFGWLLVWHLVMLTIHYLSSLKQQVANSMFYEFTKFLQIMYAFCCTQALL